MRKIYLLLVLSLLAIVAKAQTTTSFSYTGAVQTYTVGAGVTQIAVDLAGAQGGNYPGYGTGGLGGRVQGTVNVTPGQVLYVYVGQQAPASCYPACGGVPPAGGTNSGGGAQGGAGSTSNGGAGGGGSSDIRTVSGSGTTELNSRILVAGGGGGGSFNCGAENGGLGGGLTGGTGSYCSGGAYDATNEGGPGTQTAGGAAGCSGSCGTAGGFGYGGNAYTTGYGGGGGGGWYGAGGAAYGSGCGGSSYYGASAVASGASTTSGYRSGNGYVNITALGPSVTAAPSSLDFGIVTAGSTSIYYTTTLTGASLTSGGTLTITPPSNFLISLDNITYSSSALTYTFSGAAFSGLTLYVKFSPPSTGSYSGNIAITGGGLAAASNIPVTGTGANICTGTPTAGTTSITPLAGGSATTFNLTLAGYSTTGGITFQWQKSTDGGTTWTNVSGATNTTYSFSGLTTNTLYQCNVTCTNSSVTSASSASLATYYPPSSCTPNFGNACSTYPMNTSIASLVGYAGAITDPSSTCTANYTDNSSTMSVTLYRGTTYPCAISVSPTYTTSFSAQVWIDFSNNGTFETTESVGGLAAFSTATQTVTLTIPGTVTSGTYRMRIVGNYYPGTGDASYPAINPCPTTAVSYGEVRDYMCTIIPQPTCTTPTAQPTSLSLTPTLYTVTGSFTAASPAAANYLVVRTTTSTPPTAPIDGTVYLPGSSALGGVIVSNGSATTFTATGLTPGTTYYFWVYSNTALCTGGTPPQYLATSPLNGSVATPNCAISGTKTVGPTGDYPTLTAAMTALNNFGLAGPVAVELQTTYDGTGETLPVVIPNLPCVSATNNVVIRPQGTMTVSASYAGPLISMNGARYVTIDGRVGSTGSTKALTIINTNTAGQDVMLKNDAQYNKFKYTTFRGVGAGAMTNAIFVFSVSPTGTQGNSYNRIDYCDLLDGATTPLVGLYSVGTSGIDNKYDTVSNCNIANHFGTTTSAGIYLSSYNSYWTIDGNHLYHSNPYTNTVSANRYEIYVGSGGNGFQVTNNVVGYATPSATGTYSITSSTYNYIYPIYLSVGSGVPTSVQGNTISNIAQTCTGTYYGYIYCMYIPGGSVNVGDITPNTIGATTGNDKIVINNGSSTTTTGIYGLYLSGSTGQTQNIINNNIGGLTTTTSAGTSGASIYAMYLPTSANVTVTGNTIGSASTSNSIYAQSTSTSGSQVIYGMYPSISSSALVNPVISNNTIANITNNCTYASGGSTFGIYFPSSALMTISNNSIHDIAGASGYTTITTMVSVAGIMNVGSTNPSNITQNTIYAIRNTNTGALATHVTGIFYSGSVNGSITRNKIYDIRNASTGTSVTAPPVASGIELYAPGTNITVANNMISLGNSQTTNTSFSGIQNNLNTTYTLKAYYNSINIEGTVTSGALNSAAYKRGNYSTSSFTSITEDIRNNIFINNRSGGTGKHYAISNDGTTSSATGWPLGASNYNILKAANSATVGYWSADQTFSAWKTASAGDANSFDTSTVTFNNTATGNLHINMGTTANDVESHGVAISGFNTDYDNDSRPGPAGSTNGGGIAPDLGADEFDGVPNDNLPPTVTYTALLGGCGVGDRTITATIADYSGVPDTGTLRPRVYYKRTTDATWYSQPGTRTSGTGTSGTWSFTILASDMTGLATGNTVQYYIAAQDNLGQVGAIPSIGFVATNVNSVTTPPTVPNTYNVLVVLSGTKTVGTGGDYTTITAAVADYNNACLTGAVTFSLISSAYPTETFPITLNSNPFASTTNSLTISPAASTAVTVNGPSTTSAIFKFLNARYITVDGVNSGGASLTLSSTYTSTFANVWLASTNVTGPGCKAIAIKNTNLVGGINTSTNYGILAGMDNGTTPTTSAGMDNDSITVQGNTFTKMYYGIYANGSAFNVTGGLNGWNISNNTFGPATYSATDNIYYRGMYLMNFLNANITGNTMRNIGVTTYTSNVAGIWAQQNCDNLTISQNDISNMAVGYGYYTQPTCGVYFGTNVTNSTITRNNIHDISGTAASMYYAGTGISINTSNAASNILIANNMVSNITGNNYNSYAYWPVGIAVVGTSGGVKVYHNSVNLNGTFPGYNTGATGSACFMTNTSAANIDVRDNIFSNTYHNTNNVSVDKGYAIYTYNGASVFSNVDYNDYFVDGTNVLGYAGSDRTTLSAMITGFGGNTGSINVQPIFVASNNLHLAVVSANVPFLNSGTPLTLVPLDYDGTTRSGTTPVQGAHEVNIPPCNTVTLTAGVPTPVSNVFCNSGSTTITGVGATGAIGITYQWLTSADSSSWTAVSGATTGAYTPAAAITATTYYRLKIGCTMTGLYDSAAAKVTINPNPVSITGGSAVCVGTTTSLADASTGGSWISSTPAKATIDGMFGVVTGVASGSTVITYMLPTSCIAVVTMNVLTPPSVPLITATPSAVCNNSIASLGITPILPVNIIQGMESGVPVTPGTLVGGWNTNAANPAYITQVSSASPPAASPHSGSYFAKFASYNYSGIQAALISPSFNLVNKTNPQITFWVYRDNGYNTSGYTNEGWQVWINTTSSMTGATQLGFVPRCLSCTTPSASVSGTATPGSNGWYQYSVNIPASFSGATNYVLLNGVSQFGNNCYLDDVAITAGAPAPPTWTPTTDLYTNAAATLPYIAGDTLNTVYYHPTSITAATTVSYTASASNGACATSGSQTVTVNPLPEAITVTGAPQVCFGLTNVLADATTGGTWTSSNTAVATIGSASGVATGVAVGTTNISYTLTATGCKMTQVMTVNPLPANITGTPAACVGATTPLADATPTGSWSSGTTAIATIGSLDGVINGESAGLAMITYMLPTGCIQTVEATINPLPVTTVTPDSTATVCMGDGAPFTAFAPQPSFSILLQDFNAGLGTWSITNISGTTASYWQVVTSTFSGASGDGTPMLEADADATGGAPTETFLTSPGFSTLGYGSATVSFNQYLISLASSDANVDVEYQADGGSWAPVLSQVGEVSGSGAWSSSSTPEVSVSLPSGALGHASVKLRWHYNSNWGLYWDIDNIKVTAFQPPVTYAWSGVSGATGLACAACGTTTISPTVTGENDYNVVSTTSAGCQATNAVTVNVNPLPSAITGTMAVCVNSTTTMADADAGGTWSSADATVSVDAATGVVTGLSDGTALITYTIPTGCRMTTTVTVNPLPATTTGVLQVCEGLTTTLSNATTGGTWSSSFPAVATVDASGVVGGMAAGSADIYYTLTSTGCRIAANVTVNPTPSAITGGMQVCEGLTTTLSNPDAGGTWASSTPAVATVDATTGVVTGVVAGASTITYQQATGCIITTVVTVNAVPAAITGSMAVCQGLTTTLDNATSGGTWSTASTGASVSATGVVTGITAGVANITYQIATTCIATANVTVNPTPAAIDGTPAVCVGLTTVLSNTDAGGTWASGSTGIATIDATTGVLTGVIAGNSTITYQLPTGCINTVEATVNSTPAAIGGIRQVCEGLTTTLTNANPGGTWASSAIGTASVDASGIVSGLSAGVTTITYQLGTGCINTADVTVNPVPAAIIGSNHVCEGLSTFLSNSTPGGTWNSTLPAIASVNTSGTVTAYAAGVTTISYVLSATGCVSAMDVIVNPAPAAISGIMQVCESSTTNLTDASAGGSWTTGSIMTAAVDATGVVSGITAGTTPVTYTLPTGCRTVANVTVNPLPAAITGSMQVCIGLNTTLGNASTGGAWTSGATGIATVGAGTGAVSGVSAGNAAITYTLPTGCKINADVTVNPSPAAITGGLQVCAGLTSSLSSASTGGVWSSSLPTVASVTAGTGVLSGVNMGNATVTYTLPSTCKTTAVVTVNPIPAPIAGVAQICQSSTSLLTNGSAGGTWNSSTPAVATIDATGTVAADAPGTTLITYTLGTGCIRTRSVTVNALPASITGTLQLCQSATTTVSNATAGGAWSTSAVTIATISSAGVVNGGSAGTTTITYMLPTGCKATEVVTVNQVPSTIAGTPNACQGQTTALSNTVSGGAWTSGSTAVATVDSAAGVVLGVMAGSTMITYELPTGCRTTRNIIVNPQPAAISGVPQICHGSTAVMTNAVSGGVWTTSSTAVANIGLMSGVVTGVSAGAINVTYTMLTGCYASTALVVNPLPAAIAGSLNVCNGQTSALSSATTGGTWSSSNPTIASVGTTGTVTGLTPGATMVTYALSTGCKRNSMVTVNALPTAYAVSGGGNYCEGGAGVHIGLDGSNSGTNYQLYTGTTAVGSPAAGISGLPLDFGLITSAGTYSVVAHNASTGCASDMVGTTTVVVSPIVAPSVNVVTATDSVCAGLPISYTTTVVNGGTTPVYTWKVNGVTMPGATTGTFTYTPANGDVVSNTMISSNGCATPAFASNSRTMTVNANMMPVANFTAIPGPAVCEGNTATFNASSLYGGSSPMFKWMKNGVEAGTGSSFAYVPANGDNVAVKLLSNYGCRLADSVVSPAITMVTSPVYIPAIEITSNYGFFVNEGTVVTLGATVATGGPAPLYKWFIGASEVPGATGATLTKVFNNGDSVSCQVTGTGLCGMSAFNSVVMHVGPTGVATTTIGDADVRLVPNPNKGEFTVKGTLTVKADKEVAIEVTNMLGQVVYRTNVTARNGDIDAKIKLDNTLANGMYMLNMSSGSDRKVFHFVLEQ